MILSSTRSFIPTVRWRTSVLCLVILRGYGSWINNLGQIVGQSCDLNNNCHAFLWQNNKMTDLNTRIPANSSLSLYDGVTISDLGIVGGYAVDESAATAPAFVLIPEIGGSAQAAPAPGDGSPRFYAR